MQIVIDPDGSCEFTRSPELLSLLHPADHKKVERMTEILFLERHQRYCVAFLKGPPAKGMLSILSSGYQQFVREYGSFETDFEILTESQGLITFATYEDAVKAEVRYVEFLRDLGHSMK